jgi:hypothetical protein
LEKLEAVVRRGLPAFVEVGEALRTIRDERLYEQSPHGKTFEAYAFREFGLSRTYAYRQIWAAEIQSVLPNGNRLPNEAVARTLMSLRGDPEKLREAWQRATDRGILFPKGGCKEVTARDVQTEVARLLGKAPSKRSNTTARVTGPSRPTSFCDEDGFAQATEQYDRINPIACGATVRPGYVLVRGRLLIRGEWETVPKRYLDLSDKREGYGDVDDRAHEFEAFGIRDGDDLIEWMRNAHWPRKADLMVKVEAPTAKTDAERIGALHSRRIAEGYCVSRTPKARPEPETPCNHLVAQLRDLWNSTIGAYIWERRAITHEGCDELIDLLNQLRNTIGV